MGNLEIPKGTEFTANVLSDETDGITREKFKKYYEDVQFIMKNYRKLKVYQECSNSCGQLTQKINEINKVLSAYECMCSKSHYDEEYRRWNVIYLKYIHNEKFNMDEISEKLRIDRRTIYRDLKKGLEDLTSLFSGICIKSNSHLTQKHHKNNSDLK